MKRTVCLALCLFLTASLLAACGREAEITTSGSTASQQLCHSPDYRIEISDSVAYSMFTLNTDLPESFISYNTLRMLGYFDGFIQLSPSIGTGYDLLRYEFVDENDIESSLSICPVQHVLELEIQNYESIKEVTNPQDLRWLGYEPGTRGTREYIVDGISYIYLGAQGGLSSIKWVYNGIEFTFVVDHFDEGKTLKLRDYPAGPYTDTFAAKLLNVETARAAVDELMASCFPED